MTQSLDVVVAGKDGKCGFDDYVFDKDDHATDPDSDGMVVMIVTLLMVV